MERSSFFARVAPLATFLIVAVFMAIGLTQDPRKLPSELIDRAMPAFDLPDLFDESKSYTQSDLQGRITLVNIFGSWCVECLVEHPTLMDLGESDQYDLIGVNWRDERTAALNWLDEHENPYDAILFDRRSELAIELGVTGAPETFVVDTNGRIRYKHVGAITRNVFYSKIEPVIIALSSEADT